MRNQLCRMLPAVALFTSAAIGTPPPVTDHGLLPGDVTLGPAINSQIQHSAAAGAGITLVAWGDNRGASSGSQAPQSEGDVFAIRVAADGSPLDAAPFLVAGGMGLQDHPLVAWNGENWLVLYRSQEPSGGYYSMTVRAVRVSPAGQVLDPTPIAFPANQFDPDTIGLSVAGQGGQWVVTRCLYHDDGYGTYLAGQRISSAGQLIDTTPVMLTDWVYASTRILPCQGEYLVAAADWTDSSIIKAQRVTQSLQPIGAPFNLPGLTLATNGSEYYVAWIRNFTDLVGSRVTSSGTLVNPAGTLLFSDPSMAYYEYSLAHDGTNWWFERNASDDVWTMRIDPAGNVLDPGGVKLPIVIGGSVDTAYGVTLVPRASGGVHVLWYDLRPSLANDANVFSIPVSPANTPGAEQCVSTSTSNQRSPSLAGGPLATSAVAFLAEHAGGSRVLVQLLDASGAATTAQPIEVARTTSIGRAAIAWNGSAYMITWDQSSAGSLPIDVYARRMAPDGTFIDPAPVFVMKGFNPDVGALGEDFLIAASRYGYYPQYIDLVAMRVDGPTGALLDGAGLLLGGNYANGRAHVRSDGARWLVASHSMWTHNSSQGDAILAYVPPAGSPTPAFNPTPFSGASGDLDIAFSGNKYLLVWRMYSLSNANNQIAGRIMNSDGTIQPGYFTIAEAPGRQIRPTVVWDGASFLVAWEDQRNQQTFFDLRTDIYATRITESGDILDPSAFALDVGVQGRVGVSLLPRLGRSTLAAVSRFEVQSPFDSYRIGLSSIGDDGCPADFDNSGFVDTDDFDAFVRAFEAGEPAADFDRSGFVDTDDFDGFVLAFESGC